MGSMAIKEARAALTQAPFHWLPSGGGATPQPGSCGLFTSAHSIWQVVRQSYVIHSLGPGMLTTGGRKNSGSRGPPAVPKPGPQAGLRLPSWAAQEPQDTGTGSRLLYWPRGNAQGRAERPERAVPGMGTGRARAVPGMTVVGRGPDARVRHGVPTGAPGVFIYKTRRGGHMWLQSTGLPSGPKGPCSVSILRRECPRTCPGAPSNS